MICLEPNSTKGKAEGRRYSRIKRNGVHTEDMSVDGSSHCTVIESFLIKTKLAGGLLLL